MQLVGIVAEVARAAATVDPDPAAGSLDVSQRRWDQARAGAGHEAAPTAKQIASRLRMPWHDVLELALSGRDPIRALGRRDGARNLGRRDDGETDDGGRGENGADAEQLFQEAVTALRVIALRLETETLTPDAYAEERQRMLIATRRQRELGLGIELPTHGQITGLLGDWDRALKEAGLQSRWDDDEDDDVDRDHRDRDRDQGAVPGIPGAIILDRADQDDRDQGERLGAEEDPVRRRRRRRRRRDGPPAATGVDPIELADLFLVTYGGLPNRAELCRWAKAKRIPISWQGKKWGQVVEQLRRRRQGRGRAAAEQRGSWTPAAGSFRARSGRRRVVRADGTVSDRASRARLRREERERSWEEVERLLQGELGSTSIEIDGLEMADAPAPPRRDWSETDLEEAMRAFFEWLPADASPTQANYRRFCREDPGRPWPSVFGRNGHPSWGVARDRLIG